jgi:hypothetical protein
MRNCLLYVSIFFLIAACTKDHALDCFKSNGSDITELRTPGDFTTVEVNDKINLNVIKGAEYKVEVTAGRHIIKNITTKISDHVLKLDNTGKCNFVRGYKREVTVTITAPYIKQIISKGVGTVNFDGSYNQDTLQVKTEGSGDIHVRGIYNQIATVANGNGDIYLEGSCNSLYAYSNGTNFLHGENMLVNNYIFVQTLSIGDCYVNATQAFKLDYDLWNIGNIYYTGNPAIIADVGEGSGKGKVIKKD